MPDPVCGPYDNITVTGTTEGGAVWGQNPFTSDSDLNVAVVFAGLATVGQTVTIERYDAAFYPSYEGSTNNGVTTRNWGPFCGFYIRIARPPVGYKGSTGLQGAQGSVGYLGSVGYTGSAGTFLAVATPSISQNIVATGVDTYTLDEIVHSAASIFVMVNGLVLIPSVDYNIASTNIIFTDIPPEGSDIEIRYFDISQGPTGFKGSAGDVGFTGSIGSKGESGGIGYTGSAGSLGYTGSLGYGYVGSKGEQGDPVGYTGSAGAGIPTTNQLILSTGDSTYTLDRPVLNPLHVLVIVNGLVNTPVADYTVNNTNLNFQPASVPPTGSDIEIRYYDNFAPIGFRGSVGYEGSIGAVGFTGSEGLSGGIGYTGSRGAGFTGSTGAVGAPDYSQKITSTGIASYTMDRYVSHETHIIVSVNGLVQIPITDYSVLNDTLTFTENSIPNSNSDIEIRFFSIADQVGYAGSFGGTGYFGSIGYTGSIGDQGYRGSNGIAEVYISNTAPTDGILTGELWWDDEEGVLSIYYDNELTWVGVSDSLRGTPGYNGSIGYSGSTGSGYAGSRGQAGYSGSSGYTGSLGDVSLAKSENFTTITGSASIEYAADCAACRIFYFNNYSSNVPVAISNLNLASGKATNIVFYVDQASFVYIPTIKSIDGSTVTTTWAGGTTPTSDLGKSDFVSMTILNVAGLYKVFGQLVTFG